jgi:hypothetical protein
MADNFNLGKFIRNNPLLNESIGGYRDIKPMKEAEDGSFNVSLEYADYPSITDAEQRLATIHLKKLVKSLGGIATITNDRFSTVDFNVTGISSFEELQDAYNDVVENEDDDYTMLPSWDLEPKEDSPVEEAGASMYTDDSPNPFPSLVSDEDDENETYGRAFGLAGQQLKSAIDALKDDGFDDEDIKNFLMTGIDMYDQVFGDYNDLEEAEGQFQSFDWNTVDQQGNKARLVVDAGTNNAGEEVLRVGHPNTGGTLAMFTKDDILNNDGYLRVGGKNFQVQPSLINWAKS